MKRTSFALGLWLIASASQAAQDPKKQNPAAPVMVDQKRVDEAIRKGVAFLKAAGSPSVMKYSARIPASDAIILLTFLRAGVPGTDPMLQELFKRMTEGKIERTYDMAAPDGDLDRAKCAAGRSAAPPA